MGPHGHCRGEDLSGCGLLHPTLCCGPGLTMGTQGWSSVSSCGRRSLTLKPSWGQVPFYPASGLLSPVSGWPAVGSCLAPPGSLLIWWAQLVPEWPCPLLLLSPQISSDRPPLAGKAPGKEAAVMLAEQKSRDQTTPFCCLSKQRGWEQ